MRLTFLMALNMHLNGANNNGEEKIAASYKKTGKC
jgi:hypothetical protein